jgi:tetratricopeptide (TPR) repeat protein
MRVDPKYARAYTTRGITWYRKGDLERAMADFDEAIRLNPEYAPAYLARGIAREIKHGLQEALADFKIYSQLAPSDPKGSVAVERVLKKLSAQ